MFNKPSNANSVSNQVASAKSLPQNTNHTLFCSAETTEIHMKNLPEIMAPAGDFPSLDAAIKAGADAVYFGVKGFNMRAGAKNFSVAEIKKVAGICKSAGVKSYITLNTIYYGSELKKLERLIVKISAAKIDAVIAWDFGAIALAFAAYRRRK